MPANDDTCEKLVMALQGYADEEGYDLTTDFDCSDVTSTYVRACGELVSTDEATRFFEALSDSGDLADIIAPAIGFGSDYVSSGGSIRCLPSTLEITVTTVYDASTTCHEFEIISDCNSYNDEFPYCACNGRVPSRVPYSLTYDRMYEDAGYNVYCFTIHVDVDTCDEGASQCCDMTLDKIEWLANEDCQQSAWKYWLSTSPELERSPSWSRHVDRYLGPVAVMKTNMLALDTSSADDVDICFSLKATSECATLSNFCVQGDEIGCKYAFFDQIDTGCCADDWLMGTFDSRRRNRRHHR